MEGVAIIVPTIRPHRIAETLESARENTPDPKTILFVVDEGDDATADAVEAAGGKCVFCSGGWPKKINFGIDATTEPMIFTGADDLKWHPGWLEAAARHLTEGPHDPGHCGLVGTNDLGNPRVMAGHHATHFLAARWYAELGTIDERGKLIHEGYEVEYSDDELIATAKARGQWKMALDSHVEHLHPLWGKGDLEKAKDDPSYQRMKERMARGRRLFLKRAPLWA